MVITDRVLDAKLVQVEPIEGAPDIRMVVDTDHDLSFARPHGFRHGFVLLEAERHAIAFGLPVRRIHVEKGVGAIVPTDALLPGLILDNGAGQAQVCR